MYVILDLDGTLADLAHRLHYVSKEPKNWEAFFAPERVYKDELMPGAARVIAHFENLKYELVVLTARNEDLRDTTMRWLLEKLNLSLPEGHLLMRANGNMLTPAEYKREQLLNFKQGLETKDNNFLIIDDDPEVGESLKEFGVVLRAPECWALLFQERPAARLEDHA